MGLTGLLAVHFDLGLEPFAVKVKQYWLWQPTLTQWQWYTAPWVNFLGWLSTAVVVLVFTLPWLINKQPVKRPMDYHPLGQWLICAENGLVFEPQDSNQLAMNVVTILSNKKLRNTMKKNSLKLSEQHSMNAVGIQYEQVYEKTLELLKK